MSDIFKNFLKKPSKEIVAPKIDPMYQKYGLDTIIAPKAEKTLDKMVQYYMNSVILKDKEMENIIGEIESLRKSKTQLEELTTENNRLQGLLGDLRFENTDLHHQIDQYRAQIEKNNDQHQLQLQEIDENKMQIEEKLIESQKIIEKMEKEIEILKREKFDISCRLESKENEMRYSITKLEGVENELKKYKKVIISEQEIPAEPENKRFDFELLFSERMGGIIAEFLNEKEILKLRQVSQYISFCVTSQSKYYLLIARRIKAKYSIANKDIKKRLGFWQEMTQRIPEDYMRHAFSKFIVFKETVGEYIVKPLNQADQTYKYILSLDDKMYNAQASKTSEKQQGGFLSKLFAKKEEQQPQGSSPPSQLEIENKRRPSLEFDPSNEANAEIKSEGFKSPENTSRKNSTDEDSTKFLSPLKYLEIPTGRDIFLNLSPQNPHFIFIPCNAIVNEKDDKKMVIAKGQHFIEDIMRQLEKRKNILIENHELCQAFDFLKNTFTRSKSTRDICPNNWQEVEALKDFLTGKFEEAKEKILNFQAIIEDLTETAGVERKLKGYMSKKVEELESKLHSLNSHLLRDSENISLLENKLERFETDHAQLIKDKADVDSKLKVLAREVKNLRAKNENLEQAYSHVTTGYIDLKIVFDNLHIEDDI